jgi:hypothetical protein
MNQDFSSFSEKKGSIYDFLIAFVEFKFDGSPLVGLD